MSSSHWLQFPQYLQYCGVVGTFSFFIFQTPVIFFRTLRQPVSLLLRHLEHKTSPVSNFLKYVVCAKFSALMSILSASVCFLLPVLQFLPAVRFPLRAHLRTCRRTDCLLVLSRVPQAVQFL